MQINKYYSYQVHEKVITWYSHPNRDIIILDSKIRKGEGLKLIVGLDMGGTNIDGVIIKDGRVVNRVKKPTNRDDLFESIWITLGELLSEYDKYKIDMINLSTTVSTNAIVESKTSPVGMIIQSGPDMPHDFLACGNENVFISGYIDHRGEVIEDFFNYLRLRKLLDYSKKITLILVQ